MATREEWIQAFEAINGRKPTPEEFMEAKEAGFPLELNADVRDGEAQSDAQGEQLASVSSVKEGIQSTPDDITKVSDQALDLSAEEINQEESMPSESKVVQENPYLKGKQRKDNLFVNIILPIIVLVLGLLFVILAWSLPISILFTFLAFVTFVVAIIAMALSLRSSKKALSIIAVVATGIFFVSSIGGTVYQGARWIMNHADSFNLEDLNKAKEYIDANYQFNWEEQEFKDLKVGETSLEEVIGKHGLATDADWSNGRLTLYYEEEDFGSEKVTLSFEAQEGAKYVLVYGKASFETDQVKVSDDYKSNWTQSDIDGLKLGTTEDLIKGTRLSEVLEKHPEASSAHHDLTLNSDGDLVQELRVTYTDYSASGDYESSLYLTFKYDSREDAYFLSHKS